jgi:hypothetical protein
MASPIIPAADENHEPAVDWPKICKELTDENSRLHKEMAKLRDERDRYYHALLAMTRPRPEDVQFTKAEALAQTATDPTWQELLAEIERY